MKESVAEFEDGFRNISSLARLLERDRKTILKYIREARIRPHEQRGGNDVYSVSEVAKALHGAKGFSGGKDPDDMSPFERKEYYDGELKRLKFEEAEALLCDAGTVRDVNAEVIRSIGELIASFPDIAERDYKASRETVEQLDLLCDKLRVMLANALTE